MPVTVAHNRLKSVYYALAVRVGSLNFSLTQSDTSTLTLYTTRGKRSGSGHSE